MAEVLVPNGSLNRVRGGDCIAGMESLPAGCVDLAFADPPFNIGYEYDVYDDQKEWQQYLAWSRSWISEVCRVLKPTGTFWLAIGDEYAAELKLLSQEIGFHCRSWVVWYYTFGVNCTKKFSRSHAHLFHFVKDKRKFTFRSDVMDNRVPSARQLVYADARANSAGRLPDDTWILRPQDLAGGFTPTEDTWYFPRVAGTFKERAGFHGCQMPEQLLGRIIRLCSDQREVVLDPFAGSATTLVVAKKLGRSFLGFELSPEYVVRGTNRLDEARVGDPLEGAQEPLVSAPATANGKLRGKSRTSGNRTKRQELDCHGTRSATNGPASYSARTELLFENGLIEAFRRTYDGYSLDRVIADPVFNERFVAACHSLGLPGEPRDWIWRLFNYRKAGKLVGVPTARRTEFSWEHCDQYLFASEIALATMLDEGSESLDAILCDPEQTARFDQLASEFAPGFTPLEYRWAALKLRKAARLARQRARLLTDAPARLSEPVSVRTAKWDKLPDQAGLYLVAGRRDKQRLYVGEALNLRLRFQTQFRKEAIPTWDRYAPEDSLCVQFLTAARRVPELHAHQSRLVDKYNPKLNFRLKTKAATSDFAA